MSNHAQARGSSLSNTDKAPAPRKLTFQLPLPASPPGSPPPRGQGYGSPSEREARRGGPEASWIGVHAWGTSGSDVAHLGSDLASPAIRHSRVRSPPWDGFPPLAVSEGPGWWGRGGPGSRSEQPQALRAAAVFSFQPQRLFLGKQTHAQHPQPSGGFISKKPKA